MSGPGNISGLHVIIVLSKASAFLCKSFGLFLLPRNSLAYRKSRENKLFTTSDLEVNLTKTFLSLFVSYTILLAQNYLIETQRRSSLQSGRWNPSFIKTI
jgi:hypothetical protein